MQYLIMNIKINIFTPKGFEGWIREETTLKVVGNEKEGGSGRWQMIGIGLGPRRSRFVFLLNFVVVFDFMYFRFRPSNAKSIGNVLTNRQNAA
jgi:hypothetical protein